jgi:Protein of unknown function (DUF433)
MRCARRLGIGRRTLRAWQTSEFHRPEPDERPGLHPVHPGDGERGPGQLAAGLTVPELLVEFPYLDRADLLAALEFAAAAVQECELPLAQWA